MKPIWYKLLKREIERLKARISVLENQRADCVGKQMTAVEEALGFAKHPPHRTYED